QRIIFFVFTLIAVLGLLFMAITYYATTHYHQASTQLLNKDVAAHIAQFTSPFDADGLNKQKADSVFKDVMVISPSAEVYFLDTTGKVIDYHAEKSDIKLWQIPLENIKKFIQEGGSKYIKSPDPRDPSDPKIFSAAVVSNSKKLGYIYVILGSNQYRNVAGMLYSSHISNLVIKAFLFIIILSIALSFLYVRRMQKRYNSMIAVLEKFQQGDFKSRFPANNNDMSAVTGAFNKMADLLVLNIDKLTNLEKERKNFIAAISHDLRTPLSIARGYTETLFLKIEKTLDKEFLQNYLQLINNKILQIEHMVKQLFELSKMDAIEFKPKKEPFVLSEIVQETASAFQLLASEKKIILKCTQCQYHVWVNADISMMERVVQNLIENAIKHTPADGNVQVTIIVEGNNLICKIENTGNPLPEDLLQWINNSVKETDIPKNKPAKSGFGLVIVQRILFLHHLSLKAYSKDGFNIFSFCVPIYTPSSVNKSPS
ncbi:MAG: HAMP domain-containing sensor histidine kinase, partial [Ginsengibacter sp.]